METYNSLLLQCPFDIFIACCWRFMARHDCGWFNCSFHLLKVWVNNLGFLLCFLNTWQLDTFCCPDKVVGISRALILPTPPNNDTWLFFFKFGTQVHKNGPNFSKFQRGFLKVLTYYEMEIKKFKFNVLFYPLCSETNVPSYFQLIYG